MKKIISLLLAVVMAVMSFGFTAYAKGAESDEYVASGKKTAKNPADIFSFVLCDGHETAPIRIVKATLKQNGKSTKIYLVGLVGIENNLKQENTMLNALPSAFNIENGYTKQIKEVLSEAVPAGSNIVFCGHSLGGMVAQQIIADNEVKDNYNIISTMTAGSPYIVVFSSREGQLNRMCDKYDAVPFLSGATIAQPYTQIEKRNVEDGGYFFDPNGAHNYSYRRAEVWGAYDALGNKGGDATITFSFADLQTYGSNLGSIFE